jgi:hypothetical protein
MTHVEAGWSVIVRSGIGTHAGIHPGSAGAIGGDELPNRRIQRMPVSVCPCASKPPLKRLLTTTCNES